MEVRYRVIGPLVRVVNTVTLLITTLMTTNEVPSAQGAGDKEP